MEDIETTRERAVGVLSLGKLRSLESRGLHVVSEADLDVIEHTLSHAACALKVAAESALANIWRPPHAPNVARSELEAKEIKDVIDECTSSLEIAKVIRHR